MRFGLVGGCPPLMGFIVVSIRINYIMVILFVIFILGGELLHEIYIERLRLGGVDVISFHPVGYGSIYITY